MSGGASPGGRKARRGPSSGSEPRGAAGPAAPGSGPRRLMVFGKVPRAGRVKTRLVPPLDAEGAAALYAAFLRDVLDRCRAAGTRPELWVPRRPGAREELARRHPDAAVRWQADGDLGDRLRAALSAAFRGGAARALVVGSDHPTLPPSHVGEAFAALAGTDVCLGPTPDGGYWGVGARRRAWPASARIFDDIPWSTPDVLEETLARAESAGLCVRRVASWYDVDERRDLERLRRDVEAGSATAAVLDRLDLATPSGAAGDGDRPSPGGRP